MCPVSSHGMAVRRKDSVVGFEFLTTVVMKSSISWVIMSCTVESQTVCRGNITSSIRVKE
jgi:hypothetical protein